MMRKQIVGMLPVLFGIGAHVCQAGTAVVLQPVGASGSHTIVGSDIFLPAGGQRVRLEFRVAGWGEASLNTIQVTINSSSFDNGSAALEHTVLACPGNNSSGHSFCAQAFEVGSRCEVGCASGSTVNCSCQSGFINITRADFAGAGNNYVSAADTSSADYRMGLRAFDSIVDPGTSLYVGTMFLTVPGNAVGTFTVAVDAAQTFFQTDGPPPANDIPIELITPARIIIGDPAFPGSRYVGYKGGSAGTQTAVRVMLKSVYHPGPPVALGEDRDFGALEGRIRWAGPPSTFPDHPAGGTFLAAPLQCTPHFTDWGSLGTVQLYGNTVLPSSVYFIWQVPISCQDDPDNPSCFSPVQILYTGQWGDAAAPFARSDQAAQPDMGDIAAIVDGFRGAPGAASKSRIQLRGASVDPASKVNFMDVRFAVDAFHGKPFPYPVPPACP